MKKEYFHLFVTFLKIGAFTFGGGWAMISIIEKEIVYRKKWIDQEKFLDLLSIAQSMPGILAVNIAVAVGDRICGKKGSFCAAMGTILPSFFIILFIAIFFTPETIKNNEIISSIFKGIRPAVVALIIAPVLRAAKTAKITMKTVFIPVFVALLIYSKIPYISNPILFIVLGAVFGIIAYKRRILIKNKEDNNV